MEGSTPQAQAGFIAQQVQQILPNIVHLDDSGDGGMEYTKLIVYCVGAIQEQQKQITDLQNQINILKSVQ